MTLERFDAGTPHPARRYNYWLGGTDNFAADRESGDLLARSYPTARIAALANRAFLGRAVGYLAGEAGLRQFRRHRHRLADRRQHPRGRAAHRARLPHRHVDNDPLVLAHARTLLTGTPEGATEYLDADLRSPAAILEAAGRTPSTCPGRSG